MKRTAPNFTLELQTENVAAWMPINNTFAWNPKVGEKDQVLWHGVLIQLGQYVRWRDGQFMVGFEKIQLVGSNGETFKIARGAFENQHDNPTWINVVSKSDDGTDPMTSDNLPNLCPKKPLPPGDPCSLDRFFKPFPGCITLWTQNGYDLKVQPRKKGEEHYPHARYTFTIDQPCTVEIKGAGAISSLPPIVSMVICEPPHPARQQGGHQSPPQQP